MGIDSVHTLRIHDPNDNGDTPDGADEVAIAAGAGGAAVRLMALKEAGVISGVSLGMNSNIEDHQGVPEEERTQSMPLLVISEHSLIACL